MRGGLLIVLVPLLLAACHRQPQYHIAKDPIIKGPGYFPAYPPLPAYNPPPPPPLAEDVEDDPNAITIHTSRPATVNP